ncbi:amidohydrolase family protein [Polyangium fumosum]|nr:amidohydrolase family protein [Polyangium fumosum]
MASSRTFILWALGLVSVVGCSDEPVLTPSNPLPVDDEGNGGSGGDAGSGGVGGMGGVGGVGGTGGAGGMGGVGGMGGAGGAGGAGGSGGGDGVPVETDCTADLGTPEVSKVGVPGKLRLIGCVVTPDKAFAGEVLIESDTLTCVGPSCEGAPGAAEATVVKTHGIILPGMIDTHNHILFDIFDESDWSPSKAYGNHNQWPNEPRYQAMVDAKQYLNGEGTPNLDPGFGCEMNKYGEMKGLVAGTTSIAGAANPIDKTCYGSLARTIDQKANDLGADKVQVSTLFPPSSGSAVCGNFLVDKTDAYVIHCGEGVDETAKKEFTTLGTTTNPNGCLYAAETTIVHGTAFGADEFGVMADRGMSLVWSPRSNVFLYGGGTDFNKTTNVPLALSLGINVALAPDWSLGGSQNLLDELRFANMVDNEAFGDVLSPAMLVRMVTVNAAKALGLSEVLGSLEVGKKADVTVITGDGSVPFDTVLAARPKDVSLVVVNGVPLYGDSVLAAIGPQMPGCEALDICGAAKFACVAETGGNTTNKFGQTWDEITQILSSELKTYDDMNLTQWDFAPLAPLVKCE